MALDNYSELQSEALDWMERAGQSGKAPTWIKIAEAKLNRALGPVETNAALTGVVSSRSLDLSALAMVQPIALFRSEPGGSDETEVQQQSPRFFARQQDNGKPSQWALETDTSIVLNRPCDVAYSFRFRYRERFALSDSVTTNWLLTNHPDVYLAATLMWGAGYNQDWQNGAIWKQTLEEGIEEVARVIAEGHRGVLRVDPALSQPPSLYWDGNG